MINEIEIHTKILFRNIFNFDFTIHIHLMISIIFFFTFFFFVLHLSLNESLAYLFSIFNNTVNRLNSKRDAKYLRLFYYFIFS